MSDINSMVGKAIFEEKGQTAGAEMFNKGPIAGLFSEPGLGGKDGKRGNHKTGDSAGEKVEKAAGGNDSKFDVEGTPGNTEPTNPNPDKGGTPPINKFGGKPLFSAAAKLKADSDKSEIKSPEVKANVSDQPEMPKTAPA